jgi:hypothetical protein
MMKRRARQAVFAIGAAALALALTAAAAPSAPRQAKRTSGFIEAIAMDGPVLAYDVHSAAPSGPACNRVYAWNVVTKRVTRVSGRGTCEADDSSTGAGVPELAVAGSRIAWIVNIGGLSESNDRLFTASVSVPKERRLAAVTRTGDVDCVLTGRRLGGLVGSGKLLAYNIWTTVAANPGDESSCETKTTSGSLRRIGRRGTSLLRDGVFTIVARDAGAGRIAVVREDGMIAIFSSRGTMLRSIATAPPKEIALSGERLVVLTKTRTIDIYSAATGRLVAGRAVRAGAEHLDAGGGVAAYAVGTRLHLLRLATRKDSVVATAAKPIDDVAVSSRAVAYAYNVSKRLRNPPRFRDIGNVVVLAL